MDRYQKLLISPDISLKQCMKILEATSSRILFVVDKNGALLGSVADGDIRRSILNNVRFDRKVSTIMCGSPLSVKRSDKDYEKAAKDYIIDKKLHAIPVVDDEATVVNILFWHDFFQDHPHEARPHTSFDNMVVIMAGGKGERLDPFTKILPKPLIPVEGKPIIEQIMNNFNKHGFANFMLTLNYKKEMIKMYIKESGFSYKVDWIEEDEYLGTAGSLELLKDKIRDTFIVCNCDVLLMNDFRRILAWHKGEKALITLVGCHKEIVIPYGTIGVSDGQLSSFDEKPSHDVIINTGIYIMEPSVTNLISHGEKIDMNDFVERARKHGRVTVYPVADGWFDIGQWKEYRESLSLLRDVGGWTS